MGDLISREFMKSIGGTCIAQRLKNGDLCPIISIDLLPSAEPEPHWIPCSKRLPEVNDTYLVCYEDASVLMDWFNGHWFFYRTNPAIEETGTVAAWMPLPSPYQPEEGRK